MSFDLEVIHTLMPSHVTSPSTASRLPGSTFLLWEAVYGSGGDGARAARRVEVLVLAAGGHGVLQRKAQVLVENRRWAGLRLQAGRVGEAGLPRHCTDSHLTASAAGSSAATAAWDRGVVTARPTVTALGCFFPTASSPTQHPFLPKVPNFSLRIPPPPLCSPPPLLPAPGEVGR